MNFKSVIIVLAAVIAGTLGGAVTYQMAVPAGSAQPGAGESVVLDSPAKKARQERRQARQVEFAPCKPPAKLEGKRCVTDVVRTVVVPGRSSAPVAAQSAPRTASAPSAPAPAPQPVSASGSDWNDDGRGDNDSDDDSDDDDDDDGGSDDDDDSGTNTGTHTRTRSRTSGTHTASHD